jgi:hypothetical protein
LFFLALGKILEGLNGPVPQAIQVAPHRLHSLGVHVVDAAGTVAGDDNESGILQYLEVLWYGGTGHRKLVAISTTAISSDSEIENVSGLGLDWK